MACAYSFPLCAYVSCLSIVRKVTHCVPMLPITRAQSFPLCAFVGCQSLMCKSYAKFPISRYHRVPSCPCQDALVCLCCRSCAKGGYCMILPCTHVAHHLWPVCVQCLYTYYLSVVPIVCKVAHVNVPRLCLSCANVNMPRMCPSYAHRVQKLAMSR